MLRGGERQRSATLAAGRAAAGRGAAACSAGMASDGLSSVSCRPLPEWLNQLSTLARLRRCSAGVPSCAAGAVRGPALPLARGTAAAAGAASCPPRRCAAAPAGIVGAAATSGWGSASAWAGSSRPIRAATSSSAAASPQLLLPPLVPAAGACRPSPGDAAAAGSSRRGATAAAAGCAGWQGAPVLHRNSSAARSSAPARRGGARAVGGGGSGRAAVGFAPLSCAAAHPRRAGRRPHRCEAACKVTAAAPLTGFPERRCGRAWADRARRPNWLPGSPRPAFRDHGCMRTASAARGSPQPGPDHFGGPLHIVCTRARQSQTPWASCRAPNCGAACLPGAALGPDRWPPILRCSSRQAPVARVPPLPPPPPQQPPPPAAAMHLPPLAATGSQLVTMARRLPALLGVVGAGQMGAGIAQVAASCGLQVGSRRRKDARAARLPQQPSLRGSPLCV